MKLLVTSSSIVELEDSVAQIVPDAIIFVRVEGLRNRDSR